MSNEEREKLWAAYVKHRNWFIANGHPLSFGRMEGFKEVAEILGDQELVDRIVGDTTAHYDKMKVHTSSP